MKNVGQLETNLLTEKTAKQTWGPYEVKVKLAAQLEGP